MINVPMKSTGAFDCNTILSLNRCRVSGDITNSSPIGCESQPVQNSARTQENPPLQIRPHSMVVPELLHPVRKGQKMPLPGIDRSSRLKICLGWNTRDARCDVDVSAFLLSSAAKVIGDDWFVFYGQTTSPDRSVTFHGDAQIDREIVSVNFSKLDPQVTKIVFVLTINEALQNNLNFGYLSDAYIRILNASNDTEIVSFKMDEYYDNVISMMIGELYIHNGQWKFNAIGNGVAKDLEGLCQMYGVATI